MVMAPLPHSLNGTRTSTLSSASMVSQAPTSAGLRPGVLASRPRSGNSMDKREAAADGRGADEERAPVESMLAGSALMRPLPCFAASWMAARTRG